MKTAGRHVNSQASGHQAVLLRSVIKIGLSSLVHAVLCKTPKVIDCIFFLCIAWKRQILVSLMFYISVFCLCTVVTLRLRFLRTFEHVSEFLPSCITFSTLDSIPFKEVPLYCNTFLISLQLRSQYLLRPLGPHWHGDSFHASTKL